MNFRSILDLQRTIEQASPLVRQFDIIVGIPRSGILAASLLSLLTNKPLSDLDGFIEGRLLTAGRTKTSDTFLRSLDGVKTVLILDDSIANGFAMTEARTRTAHLKGRFDMTYAAVYGERKSHPEADLIFEVVRQPRMFQWNFMHHSLLNRTCVDIDGVMCPDPTEVQNDDGPLYATFLQDTVPLYVPTRRVGHFVTNRLEKYRSETEAWLRAQGIEYGQLHMNDAASTAERSAQLPGAFKARIYRHTGAVLLIESAADQADVIAHMSGRPVLCTGTWQMHLGDGAAAATRQHLLEVGFQTTALTKTAKIRAKRFVSSIVGPDVVERLKSLRRR